ncbi:SGNH/GDSL hydrolase family protein [Aestuariivivens sediminicola]|uniref:SGNH/GDSL hydrolase family protein n=1 Tax=Aestuariivivens sediminicola TaxID=2913560 RepID=UPI001F5A305D|nr:SGNH/GDSL hydrolase family protein [Aestuariivivens sediminicola]
MKKRCILICLTVGMITLSEAQDWGNLKRYQSENLALEKPDPDVHRVVFMGNSITEGWKTLRPEYFSERPYINRGISGQTTPQMLLRFRQDVVNLSPSVVVILAGINDIAENTGPTTIEMIMDNIISMAEIARSNRIKVVLCSVLPAFDFPWRPGLNPSGKVIRLNALIQEYAKAHHLEYVDYFSAMADERNGLEQSLGDDGVHPNAKGYAIMERLLEKTLSRMLKD